MTARTESGSYRFDAFRLDLGRGAVLGPDGAELRLRPKAFALLRYLLDHPGRLLGREELLDALWPGIAVTDDSLTQCIGDLRRAFGDRAGHVMRTMPKRGYVLTAEVRRDHGPEPLSGPRPEPAPAAARDVAALREDTVVFARLEAPDGQPTCLLLAEALGTDLVAMATRIEGLSILPAADAVAGSRYRVGGEVRAVGADLRVTIRLEDGGTGAVLWADRVDQPRDSPAGLPEPKLLAVAAHLNRQVARHSLAAARHKPVEALSARELTLIGRDHHGRVTEEDTALAKTMFARAIAADPDYAQAYAWQAYTVQRAITHGWGSPTGQPARDESLRLARRAVQLQPESTLCLARLAFALVLDQRWEEAVDAARAALVLYRPAFGYTRITCCEVLTAAGHPEEAARIARDTIALEPLCPPTAQGILGRALLLAGRAEEALPPLRWCASHLPDYAATFDTLVVALTETGRMPEAAAAWRELLRLKPGWEPCNHTGFWYFRRPEDLQRFEAAHRRAAGLAGDARTRRADPTTHPAMPPAEASAAPPPARAGSPATLRQEAVVLHPLQTAPDAAASGVASAIAAASGVASAIAADLMGELVRYEDLRVLAGPDTAITQGFAVRGDVRAGAGHLGAHLRLGDLATGATVWAHRITWPCGGATGPSIDEIAALAAAMDVQIGRTGLRRARQKPLEELTAREFVLLGKEHYYRSTEEETASARRMFTRAAALDPGYAPAFAWQAFSVARAPIHGWGVPDVPNTVGHAVSLARSAVELEPESPLALASLSLSLALGDHWDQAVVAARDALRARSIAGDGARIAACDVLAAAGYPEEAEEALQAAVGRNPYGSPVLHAVLGRALLLNNRPEEAVSELRLCAVRLPDYALCFRTMVVAAIEAGLIEDAGAALREVARLRPDWIAGVEPIFWLLRRPQDVERWEAAFRMAVRLDATAQAGGLMKCPASRA